MSFNMERFRSNVKYLCDKHKVKQYDVEKTIGTGAGYLSRNGKNAPGVDKIIAIAEYFDITMDSLINENLSIKDKNNISLLRTFVEKLIDDTKLGNILWNVETNIGELAYSDIPLFTYVDFIGRSEEDDELNDGSMRTFLYEGLGEFENIVYIGLLKSSDYFMLVKVSEENEKGWVLYRVFYKEVQHEDDEGFYTTREVSCDVIYTTLHNLGESMIDVTNRLVNSIVQGIDDIYLDWGIKEFILSYLG